MPEDGGAEASVIVPLPAYVPEVGERVTSYVIELACRAGAAAMRAARVNSRRAVRATGGMRVDIGDLIEGYEESRENRARTSVLSSGQRRTMEAVVARAAGWLAAIATEKGDASV